MILKNNDQIWNWVFWLLFVHNVIVLTCTIQTGTKIGHIVKMYKNNIVIQYIWTWHSSLVLECTNIWWLYCRLLPHWWEINVLKSRVFKSLSLSILLLLLLLLCLHSFCLCWSCVHTCFSYSDALSTLFASLGQRPWDLLPLLS